MQRSNIFCDLSLFGGPWAPAGQRPWSQSNPKPKPTKRACIKQQTRASLALPGRKSFSQESGLLLDVASTRAPVASGSRLAALPSSWPQSQFVLRKFMASDVAKANTIFSPPPIYNLFLIERQLSFRSSP